MKAFLEQYSHKPLPPFSEVQGQIVPVVNHGRWIAECPNRCGGAVVASEAEPYFICPYCGSPENGGRWYRVAFPPDKAQIENALRERKVQNQNWFASEKAADLVAENRARGVG